MKKVLCVIISVMIFLPLFSLNISAKEKNGFSGSRTLICTFDKSDVNNFIDGGLKTFKGILEKSKFDWCKIETENLKRDIQLKVSFSFKNINEYKAHMKQLLSYNPVVIYEPGENFIFAEGFDSSEMLNFIQIQMLTENVFGELKFDYLLTVQNCQMLLNGKKYETTDNFDIRKRGNPVFDSITFTTESDSEGGFKRTISAQSDKVSSKETEAMLLYFEHSGDVQNNSSGNRFDAQLTFNAENEYELLEKTLYATGLTESKIETEKPNSDSIEVSVKQRLGIQKILNTDGKYEYTYTFPEYYTDLAVEQQNELVLENKNKIIFSGITGRYEYSYNRGLKLSFVKIETDISGFSSDIKRKVTFALPDKAVDLFEGKIKSRINEFCATSDKIKFEEKREGVNKLYILTFSSKDAAEMGKLTKNLFGGKDSLKIKKSVFPFGENSVKESISVNSAFEKMVPVSQIEQSYVLLDESKITSSGNENYSYFNNLYTVTSGNSASIDFEYKTVNKTVVLIILGGVVVVAAAGAVSIIIIRKKIKKSSNKTESVQQF